MTNLEELNNQILNCQKCKNVAEEKVLGTGPQNGILVIGEAPGFTEREKGIPFIGKTGQMLRGYIREYLCVNDQSIRISNSMHCHPLTNDYKTRAPSRQEIFNCNEFLKKEIEVISPTLIILVGRISMSSIFGFNSNKISDYVPGLVLGDPKAG